MKITNTVKFDIHLALEQAAALDFVRDVRQSLAKASFLSDLQVSDVPAIPTDGIVDGIVADRADNHVLAAQTALQHVQASIVVNAALFGERALSFQSYVRPTAKGALLEALPFDEPKLGWAEVSGDATVHPLPQGSRIRYHFDITIHLDLPEAEKWGGRALSKMIHFTAQRTLERIVSDFPVAIQAAADATHARYTEA